MHVVYSGINGKRVTRRDQALLNAGGDYDALENVLVSYYLPQQALDSPVLLNGGNQGMQLFAQLFVQGKVIFERPVSFLPQLKHLLLISVVVLPQYLRRIAAQMPARGQPLQRR